MKAIAPGISGAKPAFFGLLLIDHAFLFLISLGTGILQRRGIMRPKGRGHAVSRGQSGGASLVQRRCSRGGGLSSGGIPRRVTGAVERGLPWWEKPGSGHYNSVYRGTKWVLVFPPTVHSTSRPCWTRNRLHPCRMELGEDTPRAPSLSVSHTASTQKLPIRRAPSGAAG